MSTVRLAFSYKCYFLSVLIQPTAGAWVQVLTAGGVFDVASASLVPNERITFNLGKVWYELDVKWNDGRSARRK